MKPGILALATGVPPYPIEQKDLEERFRSRLGLDPLMGGRLTKFLQNSAIDRRYSVIPHFADAERDKELFGTPFPAQVPSTQARNAIYKREAPKLAQQVATDALEEWGGAPSEITHVISVSCTGMMAPGIELLLVDQLGLARDVQRLGLNFMGCFGAIRGLAAARALAAADPNHRILLVCTELCTLHLQTEPNLEVLVGNALFGDGAAAAIVGQEESPLAFLEREASHALPDSAEEMTWEVCDVGLRMRLTTQVPPRIRGEVLAFANRLKADGVPLEDHGWAVHPGGKAILHGVAQSCGLEPHHLAASRAVLRQYGNMSSPSCLFVLEELLKQPQVPKWLLAFAFGPGLSLEGLLMESA